MSNVQILALQQLRRVLQNSKKKVFVFQSEEQPDHKPMSPINIKMLCWFSEVWPQTKTIVMKSNCGEICFRQVKYVIKHSDSPIGEALYTIHCANHANQNDSKVFVLREYV